MSLVAQQRGELAGMARLSGAVIAYLFELSKLPAGQQELPAVRDQLDRITIGR